LARFVCVLRTSRSFRSQSKPGVWSTFRAAPGTGSTAAAIGAFERVVCFRTRPVGHRTIPIAELTRTSFRYVLAPHSFREPLLGRVLVFFAVLDSLCALARNYRYFFTERR